jgi:hypothetical protein
LRSIGLITLLLSGLLAAVGFTSFFLSTSDKPGTALITAWIGLLFLVFGLLILVPNFIVQMIFVHLSAGAALLLPLGIVGRWVSAGFTSPLATAAQVSTVVLLWGYAALCISSFLKARRIRKEQANAVGVA